MPQISERKRHNRKFIIAIVVLVLAVVLLFGLVSFWHYEAVQADNQKFDSAAQLAKYDNSHNDFVGAAQVWVDYGDSTPNKDHKNTAYIKAAGQYVSGKQYTDAVKMCKRAEGVSGVTFEEAEVAATAYRDLGDKQNAIKYYQDAIRLFPKNIVDRGATIASFQREIQQLQEPQ